MQQLSQVHSCPDACSNSCDSPIRYNLRLQGGPGVHTHNLAGSVGLFEHREKLKMADSKGCRAVLRPLAAVNFTECSKIILLGRSCLSSFCLWVLGQRTVSITSCCVIFGYPPVRIVSKCFLCLCVLLWSPNFSGPQFPDLILSRLGIKSCGQDLLTVKPCYKQVVSVNY